ncbi:MAG: hypothetical protein ACRDY7_07995 [Acidimicrobiia bacterium]
MKPSPKAIRRLATDLAYDPTLEEWNWLLDELGRAYKTELARRTMFESELFRINSHIIMGHVEDYLRTADRIRAIERRMASQDVIAVRLPVGTKTNFICLAAVAFHYFAGRELFIELGDIDTASDLEDHLVVLDFWRRATIALRTDRVLANAHATPPHSSQVLDDHMLARIVNDLIPVEAELLSTTRQFSAQLMSYCFLERCDSRLAVCDTGPYPLGEGRFLAVRELCTDTGDFDWTDGIRDLLPHHNFVVAYSFGDGVRMETNVWGTAWFTPHDYLKQLEKVRCYVTDNGALAPLTVSELRPLTANVRRAHKELYVRYARMSRRERAVCATKMYSGKLKSWARAAGAFDDIGWDLSPRVLGMYDRVSDDDLALELLGRVFVPAERDSVFRPLE